MTALTLIRGSAAATCLALASMTGLALGTDTAPTLAAPSPLVVGQTLPPDQVHLIERNGLYGLGSDLPGTRYAVANGHLIRVESDSLRIRSVLRQQSRILD